VQLIIMSICQLRPLAAFRAHVEDVRVIVPLSTNTPPIGHHCTNSATATTETKTPQRFDNIYFQVSHIVFRSNNKPTSHSFLSSLWDRSQSSRGDQRTQSMNSVDNVSTKSQGANAEYAAHVLSVGKGYRCLIQRFIDNYRDDAAVLESRNRDSFAIMWSADQWNAT
jgi:hypothetical protein